MPVEYDLISVSSYRNGTAPGAVRLVQDLERPIARRDVLIVEDIIDTGYTIEYLKRTRRDVLIVEDIIDTGYTIEYLKRNLAARNPASLRVCTLIDKVPHREIPVKIDYIGFPLEEDAFVVGYGMDYGELYRNLPYIGVLNPEQMK